MTWTAPAVVVDGEPLTAPFWNAQVKGNLEHLSGAAGASWEAYTPTWSATSVYPGIVDGTLAGTYQRIGNIVIARFLCLMGASTLYGTGTYGWELPQAAISSPAAYLPLGGALLWDNSGSSMQWGECYAYTSGTVRIETSNSGTANPLSPTVPWTWAVNDYVHALLVYEAA